MFGRTWIYGRTTTLMDVFKREAWKIYNQKWDGCRHLWKENYRRWKMIRFHTDHPIKPPDPKEIEYERGTRT